MKIFRSKKNGALYTIDAVMPRGYTGSWLEARALVGDEVIKRANIKDFELVAER